MGTSPCVGAYGRPFAGSNWVDVLVFLRHEGEWNMACAPDSTQNLCLYLSNRFLAFNTFTIKSPYFFRACKVVNVTG